MFRPFRIIVLALLGFGVYAGFFQSPDGNPDAAAFDPIVVAAREVEAWKAAKAREDVSTMIGHTFQVRELHRFSWFRAVQAGVEMGRVSFRFVELRGRYELVLENLKAVLAVEQAWKGVTFDPEIVSRTQLNWMITSREPTFAETIDGAGEMAAEYGARWGVRPELMYGAAAPRFEAFKAMITVKTDPDWDAITRLLEVSYTELRKTLQAARTTR